VEKEPKRYTTMGTVSGKNDPTTNHHDGHGSGSGLYRRRASYAGSWYDSDEDTLQETLSGFLGAVDTQPTPSPAPITPSSLSPTSPPPRLRALIAPHAGYSYSGSTAAYAYAALQTELTTTTTNTKSPIRQILVLHPSHHVYMKGCAVSGASVLETPVGSLTVDDHLRKEILGLSNKFTVMEQGVDEKEHSGEMQYPYLAQILKTATAAAATTTTTSSNLRHQQEHEGITVLPVMCGSLSVEQEQVFGKLLADIIARPSVLTVVSTDFCHWGSRFGYQPTPSEGVVNTNSNKHARSLPLHEFIEGMDRQGMSLIELQQPGAFAKYLQETKNTVCGRHAVAVWMRAVEAKKDQDGSDDLQVNFVRYAQSSPVQSMNDSSVSYAAAVATTTSAVL
jgi:AmmeMemoRadiSam system protein B